MASRTLNKNLKLPPDYPNKTIMIQSVDTLITIAKEYIKNEKDIQRIRETASYVKKKFNHITRKDGSPYYYHLLTTAYLLAQWKCSPSMIIAGLLHDLIEDIEGETFDTVKENFGEEVAFLVNNVTKARVFEKSHQDILGINMRKILLGMVKDVRVMVIKMADRMNNVETLHYLNKNKQVIYANETINTYVPISRALGFNEWAERISMLCFWYTNREKYLNIYNFVQKLSKNNKQLIDSTINIIKQKLLKEKVAIIDIYGRQKSISSINKKIQRKDHIENINDIFAIRIICQDKNECYKALGSIHQEFHPVPDRFKDYILLPKGNMYQSLHTTVIINNHQIEIQIRTPEMHEIAEFGIAAHWKYKEQSGYHYNKQHKEIANKISILRNIIKFDETNTDVSTDLQWWKDLQEEILSETFICMTPRKKIIELKTGSTVLDFAFHIHTEVGLNAIRGLVNGISKPLRTKLKAGDIVEIVTSNKPNFSDKWLSWVISPTAKNKLKKALKSKEEKEKKGKEKASVERGKNALRNYLKGTNMWSIYQKNKESVHNFLMKMLNVSDMDKVYQELSISRKKFNELFNFMFAEFLTKEEKINFSYKKDKKIDNKPQIAIDGVEGLEVKLAKCCNPIYGDDIIALVSRRSGLTVHLKTCRNVLNITQYYDSFDALWIKQGTSEYKAKITVESLNGSNAVDKLISLFASLNIKIIRIHNKIIQGAKLFTQIEFYIKSVTDLNLLIQRLNKLKDVYNVKRRFE